MMGLLFLVIFLTLSPSFYVDCLAFKSIRLDSSSISAECKKDEGSVETNDWTTCMKYCSVEKCNGISALVENGKCHCVNDSCVPNEDETNGLTGDAMIMTSRLLIL